MKPVNSGGHAAYQSFVCSSIIKYCPSFSSVTRNTLLIAERFFETDLSEVDLLMRDRYSDFGPKPRLPSCMLRSMLLSIELRVTSFTQWVRMLHESPLYAILSGFSPEDVPGVGTFYDFASRLWMLKDGNLAPHIRMPEQKISAPSRKGQKADSIEKVTVKSLLDSYRSTPVSVYQPYSLLYSIFHQLFLNVSVRKGQIDPKHLTLSGDGTPIMTSHRERSREVYSSSPVRKRYYSQPDCDIGWDSSRDKFYFGYSLYMLTDAASGRDLPIFPLLGPASRHDSMALIRTWFAMKAFLPDVHVDKILLDAAHDAMPFYQYFHDEGVKAFIDLNSGRGRKARLDNGIIVGSDGIPVCQAGLKMIRDGVDHTKMNIKFRCPYAWGKEPISSRCCCPCSDSSYGRVIKIPSSANLRLFMIPPRLSREWKKEYNARTASERSNKREKIDFLIENGRHRSSKMWCCRLFCIAMCQHLDAWDLPDRFTLIESLKQATA